jgi:peptide/nickel transport system substrate-binding protein
VDKRHRLDRRDFLHLSAVAAGSTMLAACGGGDTNRTPRARNTGVATTAGQPTTRPEPTGANPTEAPDSTAKDTVRATEARATTTQYKESPQLAALVEQGKLPAVDDRLPRRPYVVPHEWVKQGKYGGRLRMAGTDPLSTRFVQESMYGHSPLRWLKDGLEIGPGLAESWESSDDASEWTFHFREGLRWSDGEPWTTADIMYWWEDMVLNDEYPSSPPDEARSGKGTTAELRAPNDTTLTIRFDAPAPLTADRVAMWVNRGIGPDWMQPKHYMKQFHRKYNPEVGKDWMELHEQKKAFATNPGCPTMTGWKLKAYREGQFSEWERNPYYWCVTKNGDQLPYIDGIRMAVVQNPEVFKLELQQGAVDYVHGGHTPLALSDVGGLRRSRARSGLELRFWDSGSGTGSIFYFNYDHEEPGLRKLFRDPRFRKAVSHAFNREQVRRAVYFNTGELTTGTMSPKAIEYKVNDQGARVYASWRDSALEYNPEMARRMLDELGVRDTDGDGWREMPDGSKLIIRVEWYAEAPTEHIRKNKFLEGDLQAVGLDVRLNAIPLAVYDDDWQLGKRMTKTAGEVGDGPNHLVFPQWVVPVEPSRWAPLHGAMYEVRGTSEEKQELDKDPYERTPPRVEPEKGGPIDRLWTLYDQSKVEPDAMRRHKLVWEMVKVHVEDGPFFMGVVANYPTIVLVGEGLENVPRREDLALGGFVNPWIIPSPAVYDPESYYWNDPENHT